MATSTAAPAGVTTFQGIEVPSDSVNPAAFQLLTRRHRYVEKSATFAGLGNTDSIELKKSDILAGIYIRFTGSVTITSTPKTTMRWPYDLLRYVRVSANGQTNLINCSGLKLKAREHMQPNTSDRGVAQTVGTASLVQGTLSRASEEWGIAPNATQEAGTYDVELLWHLAIADDPQDIAGALFLQTSTMDATVQLQWAQASDLVDTAADLSVSGTYQVTTEKFSIPVAANKLVLPDLSMFHSIVETRQSGLATGDNEIRLAGQGAGKQLLRIFYQVWNGSTPAPLAANTTNYGPQGWRYGSNETPEVYGDGQIMREINEAEYNSDIGATWGFLSHEFEVTNAFRDSVDMGQTAELRLLINIASGVSLSSPVCEYVQELMFASGS